MRRLVTLGGALFLVVLASYLLCLNGVWATDHTTSLTQLDYALWSSHGVALGEAARIPPPSVDDFTHDGQVFSALAPGAAFLALPFLGVAFILEGGYSAFGTSLLASEAAVSLAGAVAAFVLYRLGCLYFRRSTAAFLAFAFAFSTIAWPFATYFFQSDISAMFLLLAAYFGVKAGRSGGAGAWPALAAGGAAGIAFTTDYVEAVAIPILFAFLLVSKRGSVRSMGRSAGALLLGALPGVAAIGAYNYAIFGSPFVMTEQAYLRAGSLLGSFSTPLYYGVALDLFSLARGLFIFAPIVVIGVLGYADALRARGVRLEMLVFLALFVGILLPYAAWYDPAGGSSFGPRFLVAAIPFLLLPAGYVFEQARTLGGWAVAGIYSVYAAGASMNGAAALVRAIPPITPFSVSPFLKYTLPAFLAGNFDTPWPGSLAAGVAVISLLGVGVPLLLVELARRGEGPPQGAERPVSF